MIFAPDLAKQVQDVVFSRKTKKLPHGFYLVNDIALKNRISKKP